MIPFSGCDTKGPVHTGPKSLEVNPCNLDRPEHGSWNLPLRLRSIRAISTVQSMEVGTCHFTRGPKSLEVNPCNLDRPKHGSLGLITSKGVPCRLRSIHAISTVQSKEVETYHFTGDPKSLEVDPCNLNRPEHGSWDYHFTRGPKPLEVNPCNLDRPEHAWKLGLR